MGSAVHIDMFMVVMLALGFVSTKASCSHDGVACLRLEDIRPIASAGESLLLLQQRARQASDGDADPTGQSLSEPVQRPIFDDPDPLESVALAADFNISSSIPNCTAQTVIDVGLCRTGTESFAHWANMLGYTTVHRESPWTKSLYKQKFANFFDTMLVKSNYTAFADEPFADNGCIIAARRPADLPKEAVKFIAVTRNAEAWLPSIKYMDCKYGAGVGPKMCAYFASLGINRTLAHGKKLAKVDGEFLDVGMSYRPVFNDFQDWLHDRWCERYSEHAKTFCKDEYSDEDWQAEVEVAREFMHNYVQKMQQCIHKDNLLVVHLEDGSLTQKMGDFLGCKGKIPPYPETHASPSMSAKHAS